MCSEQIIKGNGWLIDGKELVVLGASFGTVFGFELIRKLQTKHNFQAAHLLSAGGISFELLETIPLFNTTITSDNFISLLIEATEILFGYVPDYLKSGEFDTMPSYTGTVHALN